MIRRSKLEVLMDIMKVVAEEREAKRTKIMYKANLAWNVLKESLDSMEKKGIITSKATPAGVVVFATQEGLALLNKYCSGRVGLHRTRPERRRAALPHHSDDDSTLR